MTLWRTMRFGRGLRPRSGSERGVGESRLQLELRWCTRLAGGLLLVPLLATCIWLIGKHVGPLFDLAIIEMHVRDVGTRHTPLLGLGGRMGRWPEIGCHPGPLAFYLLAPVYRLLGSTYFALRVATAILAATAIVASLMIARRRAGAPGVVAVGAVLATLELGVGLLVITEPWNPYLPVLWLVPFLLSIWSVVAGDAMLLPIAAAMGSLCAQTHVSFSPVCGGLTAIGLLLVAGRWARCAVKGLPRRELGLAIVATVATVLVLWAPPLFEEWTHQRGNMTILAEYFRNPPLRRVGFPVAAVHVLQRLDMVSFLRQSLRRPGIYQSPDGGPLTPWGGVVVFAVWLASVAVSVKLKNRALLALHATVAATLALCLAGVARIVGYPYAHVLFFLWCASAFVLLSLLLTAGYLLRSLGWVTARNRAWALGAGVAFVALCVARLTPSVDRAGARNPIAATQVAELGRQTAEALRRYHMIDGPYLLTWQDATSPGSLGYGLLVELDRRGFRVFVDDNVFNRTVLGAHRSLDPKKATLRIHLANGAWVAEAAKARGAVRLAYSDPRSAAEREEYEKAVQSLSQALVKENRPDLVSRIETDVTSARTAHLTIANWIGVVRIIEIGMPAAVFLMPP